MGQGTEARLTRARHVAMAHATRDAAILARAVYEWADCIVSDRDIASAHRLSQQARAGGCQLVAKAPAPQVTIVD